MEENSREPHHKNWGVWPKQAAAWKQPGLKKDAPLGAVMGGFPQGNRAQEPRGGEGSEERQVGGRGLNRSLALSRNHRCGFISCSLSTSLGRQEAPPCCATPETRLDPDARTLPGGSVRWGGLTPRGCPEPQFPSVWWGEPLWTRLLSGSRCPDPSRGPTKIGGATAGQRKFTLIHFQ